LNVPAVGISMDERLDNLAEELGTDARQLLHVNDADLGPRLLALDYAWDNAPAIRQQLEKSLAECISTLDAKGEQLVGRLLPA